MVPGIPERRSHDYVRAGTTTLFAALEVATGKVIGSLHRRHRAVEFKKFLAKLDKEVPTGLDVHLILDQARFVDAVTQRASGPGARRPPRPARRRRTAPPRPGRLRCDRACGQGGRRRG